MSKDEKTFMEPQTGKEMPSTWIARLSSGLVMGFVYGGGSGIVGGLFCGLVAEGPIGFIRDIFNVLVGVLGMGLLLGLVVGSLGAVCSCLFAQRKDMFEPVNQRQPMPHCRLLVPRRRQAI